MKRSGLDFSRMSDRQCWQWLLDHLRSRENDPRQSHTTFAVARRQETLAISCLLELRARGSQLSLLSDASSPYGKNN